MWGLWFSHLLTFLEKRTMGAVFMSVQSVAWHLVVVSVFHCANPLAKVVFHLGFQGITAHSRDPLFVGGGLSI